ncbi:MAG: hypothetical protein QXY40_03095 [Candidatus Methanomethylicia archaeon]
MNSQTYRKIPSIEAIVSPVRRIYINLAGCNFNCRSCFAIAKYDVGREFTVSNLVEFILKICSYIWGI